TEDTLFGIASCTKSFTATALGILADEGMLSWNKPVRDLMPAFRMHDSMATERMTPRDLLTHRCGLPRHDYMWVTATASRADLFDRLRHLQLSKDLRSAFQYNNLMYLAAGMLVERLTGKTWETFLRERILSPLGMDDTRLWMDDFSGAGDIAVGYYRLKDKLRPHQEPLGSNKQPPAIAPAGGLASNLADMCRWLQLQMNGGKIGRRRIISEDNLREIHAPQFVVPGPYPHKELLDAAYGMGWIIQPYRGFRMVRHSGNYAGFNALMAFMPGESLGAVVLTNIGASPLETVVPLNAFDRLLGLDEIPWNTRLKREDKVQKAKAKTRRKPVRERGTRPSHALENYAGDYEHPGYGRIAVSLEKKRLKLRYNALTYRLAHHHYDVFELTRPNSEEDWKASFRLGKDGKITAVAIPFEPAVDDIVFTRVEPGEET
ncbi:MAG: serine hydrolase, partial [Acidobacteriota bacterium]